MSSEKFEDTHNPPSHAESAIENEEKSIHVAESEKSGTHDSERNQGILKEYDPTDTTLDQWTLASHLKAVIRNVEEQNLPSPSSNTTVSWNELIVRGAGAGVTHQSTIGQTLQGPVKALKAIFQHVRRPERTILHNVDGVVKAGEMLVVLGRPGSGCSTLLKALCGLTDEYLGWEGQVRYNGVDLETFKRHFRGDAVYTSDGGIPFPRSKPY
jgi:ABC-type multidrug transport system fused ATPase/permease subunit